MVKLGHVRQRIIFVAMQPLNLPPYDVQLKTVDGKQCIFDIIRKKYIVLTPEEWVRQHIIHLLIDHLHYPKGRISVERGTQYRKGVQKRTDVLVYDENGKVDLLIELKAPSVKLDQKVLMQLASYNKTHHARTLMISNGMDTYCFTVSDAGQINFLETVPSYQK